MVTPIAEVSPSDRMVISSSIQLSDMAWEMNRLLSFDTWPRKNEFPQPSALVSAGFYYTGEDDKTKCFSCDGEVSNWNSDMYPDEVHRIRFPDCLLVKGEETRNKPMRPSEEVVAKVEDFFTKKSNNIRFISRDTSIVKQPTNTYGMTTPILVNLRKSRVASGSHEGSLESLSSISSSSPIIDYTDMRYEQARLRSFAHWPKSDMIEPSNLARAGMYFIGPGDRVQCAFCKGKLEGWIRGDNPLEEHRKHFGARCRFIQGAQVCNVSIVEGVGILCEGFLFTRRKHKIYTLSIWSREADKVFCSRLELGNDQNHVDYLYMHGVDDCRKCISSICWHVKIGSIHYHWFCY